MYVTRVSAKSPLSRQTAAQLSRAAASFTQSHAVSTQTPGLHLTSLHIQPQQSQSRRPFSSTSRTQLREYFPEPEHDQIVKTETAWEHPLYTKEQMTKNVYYAHRKPKDMSDRVALYLVRLLRWGTDLATAYHHDGPTPKDKLTGKSTAVVSSERPYRMSERKWLIRFIFLESVAGVPGMVAGMLRHLHSLRRMKRDNGWIETLLEEAYNERMHLLTFLKMAEPGWFMRLMILGAQGVFFNSMFISYLISPRTCHRFTGYLEEEAVLTYTLAIQDLEDGKLPLWSDPKFRVPDMAARYWKMPEGNRTMRDLLLYIRADEAKHREVNHTFGNLKQTEDPNPFASVYKDPKKPHPGKGIDQLKPIGWERDEVV